MPNGTTTTPHARVHALVSLSHTHTPSPCTRSQKVQQRTSSDSSARDKSGRGNDSSATKSQPSSALEQLKLNSTATLHKLSKQEKYKKDLSSQEAVDAVHRMYTNSTNSEIKHNCALTLTNLYTTIDMDRDDVLEPILELCRTETDTAVLAACAKAILNRLLAPRHLQMHFIPAIVAAVRNMNNNGDVVTRRNCAQILNLMLTNCRPQFVRMPKKSDRKGSARRARGSAVAGSGAGAGAGAGAEAVDPEEEEAAAQNMVREKAAQEGVLSLLANLALTSEDAERQEHASAALLNMSQLTPVHNDLSSRTVLPVIVSMLSSPSQPTSDNASLLMYALTESPDESVSARLVNNDSVAEAVISTAISQAAELTEKPELQTRARDQILALGAAGTAAMLRLSKEPLLLSIMVQGGVADALFSWFKCGDDEIKHHCVVALCNLFACEEGQAALVELGFVGVLIAAADIKPQEKDPASESTGSGGAANMFDEVYEDPNVDIGVRKRCSSALCMLSKGGDDIVQHLIEEDAVTALVKLSTTIDAEVRVNCVQALMYLSRNPASHAAMIHNKAIGTLTKFSKSKSPAVLEACTLGLCNLAYSESSHLPLLENDVINTLVRLAAATGLRQQCVSAFCQLSAFRPAHKAIIEQGVLPMLIAQSRFTNAHIRRECAQALYNLSCLVGSEAEMVAHGVPAALTIVALFRADDGLTKDLCAAALFNLMYDPAGRQQLMDDGVLWAFIKLALAAEKGSARPASSAEDHEAADTAQTCTRLICNLACEDAMVQQTVEKRTLAALDKFSSANNHVTRLNCATSLCEMARRKHLHAGLLGRGGVKVLAGLAHHTRNKVDMQVAQHLGTTLYRLTRVEEVDTVTKVAALEATPRIMTDLAHTAIKEGHRLGAINLKANDVRERESARAPRCLLERQR